MLNEANNGQMPAKCIVGPVIICQSIFDHHPAYIAAAVSYVGFVQAQNPNWG